MAKLKTTDLIAIAAVAFVLFYSPAVVPDVSPIPAPDVATQTIVQPITAVLAGHKAEAAELAAFYHTAADVVRRDGAGNKIISTTAQLRVFLERAVTLRFQGIFSKVPNLSEAIHGPSGALSQLLGLEVAELD
ncbi:MAG: hypothetical protein RBR44_05660, partial [Bacilli bacterium]|nr:hypothetical protein [Bacilli bacterium]